MSNLEEPPAIPKTEHSEEESFSDSSPELDGQDYTQETAQVQKRKGGRKPVRSLVGGIYATSEERKQRNRQAQAAFRERRTEYIKQLETTIKHHEENLQNLQQSHRSAADECLMLRYKNSLLERIDVQAELKLKTDTHHVSPHVPHPAGAHASPGQRANMSRHSQVRRTASANGPKGPKSQSSQTSMVSDQSTRSHPTPPLPNSSPVKAKSSMSSLTSGFSGGMYSQSHPHAPPPLKPRHPSQGTPGSHPPSSGSMQGHKLNANGGSKGNDMGSAPGPISTYWQPPFRSHYEQLGKLTRPLHVPSFNRTDGSMVDSVSTEQEYDAHADMLDEDPSDHSAGPGPYPENFYQQSMAPNHQIQMSTQGQPPMRPGDTMQQPSTSHMLDPQAMALAGMSQGFDPFDPMLDADPFGLTASMHFPTQFTYQEKNQASSGI
ncbi:MAG: hypothetical protein Q9167_000821 [Letrouitia subvulpina]